MSIAVIFTSEYFAIRRLLSLSYFPVNSGPCHISLRVLGHVIFPCEYWAMFITVIFTALCRPVCTVLTVTLPCEYWAMSVSEYFVIYRLFSLSHCPVSIGPCLSVNISPYIDCFHCHIAL